MSNEPGQPGRHAARGRGLDLPTPSVALAIAAHPDDVELTCGGTLARWKRMGRSFGIVDLTRGEMGLNDVHVMITADGED